MKTVVGAYVDARLIEGDCKGELAAVCAPPCSVRNSPQCLHLIALALIGSAQNGHGLVAACTSGIASIVTAVDVLGGSLFLDANSSPLILEARCHAVS